MRQLLAEDLRRTVRGALASYARRTDGTTELLSTFALQAGGEGGARLARKAGVPISPDTLLRLLHAMLDEAVRTPRVLGVDDVALRRGAACAVRHAAGGPRNASTD